VTFPAALGPRGDRGSLAMAVLLTVVGVSLAGLLAAVTLGEITSTRSDMRRGHTLHAAQAGLDALLAQIRAADDGSGNGVRASLPCGPLAGAVGGGTAETYQVAIYYVGFDPQSQMKASQAWFAANDINCTAGSGPATLPTFAVAFATGTEAGSTRVVRGAYRLRTTNQNIAGGPITVFYDNLCMDSGATTSPAGGTPLQMRTCDATRKEQVFAYRQDSTLQLVNSVTSAQPNGMCLDAGSPQAEGNLVRFETCASPATARQQWRYNDMAMIEGLDAAGNNNGFMFQLTTAGLNTSTVKITKTPTGNNIYNNANSFMPDAKAGAGNAGPQNKQLVNFKQFGRCLDLNGGNYQNTLITWPCKPSWNQAFTLPALGTDPATAVVGKITMTVGAGNATPPGFYCLRSPRTTWQWSFPMLVSCTATDPAPELRWRAIGYTGKYGTSYQLLDVDGNCVQPSDAPTDPEYFDVGALKISMIVLRPCTDSLLQKWNADPNILSGLSLKYLGEN